MEQAEIKAFIKDFEQGRPLDDWELTVLIAHYSTLERSLAVMPAEYLLMWSHVRKQLRVLEGFKAARAKNKKERSSGGDILPPCA